MRVHRRGRATAAAGLVGLLGCDGGGTYEISEVRELKQSRGRIGRIVTDVERFPSRSAITWNLPAGWHEKPDTEMRIANFGVDSRPGIECYISMLPGSAGGLAANVDRWRGQMGLEPLGETGVLGLPKTTLLGREGVWVDLQGTYTGMGSDARSGARMLGAIASFPGFGLFVKMIGPAADVEAEEERIRTLVGSIRPDGQPPMSTPAPIEERPETTAGSVSAPQSTSGDGFSWSIPDGWRVAPSPESFIPRLVTLVPEGKAGVECYATVLSNDGGGVLRNFIRWSGQVGAEPVTAEGLEALPTIDLLGGKSPLLEATGAVGDDRPATTLLGAFRVLERSAVSVKMIGPSDLVIAERDRFVEFCGSLVEESS